MPPRITINLSGGELQSWLNPEGRDLLVRQLQCLSEASDHFHIHEIIEWGKVLFRPDEWDARYFPHVLDEPEQSGS